MTDKKLDVFPVRLVSLWESSNDCLKKDTFILVLFDLSTITPDKWTFEYVFYNCSVFDVVLPSGKVTKFTLCYDECMQLINGVNKRTGHEE